MGTAPRQAHLRLYPGGGPPPARAGQLRAGAGRRPLRRRPAGRLPRPPRCWSPAAPPCASRPSTSSPSRPCPSPTRRRPHELAALDRSGAVRLFVQRAQAARPDFRLTAENAPAVAEICRLLDGLPLALELAAARIKLLPPQALLDRLRPPLAPPALGSRGPAPPRPPGLLTGGARDLPERQQTLRRTLDWSYDLLSPARAAPLRPPRRLRRGLHPGSRHRGLRRPEALPTEPLDLLASLVDKSLLRQEEPGPRRVPLPDAGDGAGVRRRAPGAERRGARRAPGPRRPLPGPGRAGRAGAAGPAAGRSGSSASAPRTRTSAPPSAPPSPSEDATTALRLGGALWWYWYLRGLQREGRGWLRAALALGAGGPPPGPPPLPPRRRRRPGLAAHRPRRALRRRGARLRRRPRQGPQRRRRAGLPGGPVRRSPPPGGRGPGPLARSSETGATPPPP